ncbi:hypothetical protein DDZ13_08790 [Coraliomargarita sinensis]|uniref:DUF1853 domain-containing protein n=1 Tax=Coraliomargarita sinensis TaxID=2174842 RepID=A0A317ZF41_9BACT|nr:DUF1853 family protein [Coraliomargarita sinensis]PXA04125.1 hypothetical protein DDZ13_08790 [Coraliomargarita sinensis]
MNPLWSHALTDCLKRAPLLVDNLPEAAQFDRRMLGPVDSTLELNAKQKLGHLYESALEALLRESRKVDLLASSLQVVDASGRTLGEMDYLLRDRANSGAIHLELAVKFYLAHHSATGWSYPGPDPKDDWYGKLERMRDHQLQLSKLAVAKEILRNRYEIETVSVQQLIYGRLFLPFDRGDCPMPDLLSPQASLGRWLYVNQRAQMLPSLSEVHLLPKALWPVQVSEALLQTMPRVTVAELEAKAQARCVMFILPDSAAPVFLVPDHWPGRDFDIHG